MNIWNKVFLGLIFVLAIAVVTFASVEFHIRNRGQKTIDSLTKDLTKTKADIEKIEAGTKPLELSPNKSPSEWSFDELKGLVRERSDERGRAWFGCIVAGADEQTRPPNPEAKLVKVQIIVTGRFWNPQTNRYEYPDDMARPDVLKGVVYVFAEGAEDDPSDAGLFLGRFKVESDELPTAKFLDDEGNERNSYRVTLVTTDPINDDEIGLIFDASGSRWAIYLTPPVDRVAGIFDQLTEEEKQAIPEELQARFQPRPMPELTDEDIEYIQSLKLDGLDVSDLDSRTNELLERAIGILERDQTTMDSTLQSARDKVVAIWKRYREAMDDSEAEFAQVFSSALDALYQQRNRLYRNVQSVKSDIEMYKTSGDKARAESEALSTRDIPLGQKRVAAMEVQRNEVKDLLTQYKGEATRSGLQIEKLQTLAAAYVARITEAQLKAAEKIEERASNGMQERE